ncbi:hypothetical protein [Candidatus Laterigemmans baculatus]|uniref:hypothetical protein n=1 Tax=Candidatus Laterigemmans baculatus TaxID=2770505 RepID=UPI0013DB72B4|nr:hypothetical protein [Candidatus Laterigemmans baculatus]
MTIEDEGLRTDSIDPTGWHVSRFLAVSSNHAIRGCRLIAWRQKTIFTVKL